MSPAFFMWLAKKLRHGAADECRQDPCAKDEDGADDDVGEVSMGIFDFVYASACKDVLEARVDDERDNNGEGNHDDRL